MLEYDFMRTAFAAAAIVAVVAGLVGYFLVLRGQTFAGHALAHVGFTGATGEAAPVSWSVEGLGSGGFCDGGLPGGFVGHG
jgi:zinc/manganese transport system permease protein